MVDPVQGADAVDVQEQEDTNGYSDELVVLLDPTSAAAEAYRTLRTNLFYAVVDDLLRVIVVTSPGRGEGKSTTCANLGAVLARAGKNTLILDCDLRRPNVHKIFGLRNIRGLVNVLAAESSPQEIWQEPLPGLKVLTAGSVPPNPTELLDSKRFAELLDQMRRQFDYVLVDAPPVAMVSDPLILATRGDGVLLTVDAQSTRKVALRRSMRSLQAVDAKVIGTVMNNVEVSGGRYGRYQFYTYE